MGAHQKSDRRRVDTKLELLQYDPLDPNPASKNCGSLTVSFGESSDFSLSFCPRHSAAWPAAFQITIKNNAKSSLFELLRDVFSKRFQSRIVRRLNDNGQYFF